MEPTLSSEMSAFKLQTPGKFPKEHRLYVPFDTAWHPRRFEFANRNWFLFPSSSWYKNTVTFSAVFNVVKLVKNGVWNVKYAPKFSYVLLLLSADYGTSSVKLASAGRRFSNSENKAWAIVLVSVPYRSGLPILLLYVVEFYVLGTMVTHLCLWYHVKLSLSNLYLKYPVMLFK